MFDGVVGEVVVYLIGWIFVVKGMFGVVLFFMILRIGVFFFKCYWLFMRGVFVMFGIGLVLKLMGLIIEL